jgi:hypothetical protein
MIKYRTRCNTIKKVEIIRETKNSVFVKDQEGQRREAKRSSWDNWHDSFEDAKAFLVENAEREVAAAQAVFERWQAKLAQARALREDQPSQ